MLNISFSKALLINVLIVFALSGCVNNVTSDSSTKKPELKPARIEASSTDYFGTTLSDPYQWMEKKDNAKELKSWMLEQGQYTAKISAQNPRRDAIFERLKELQKGASSISRVKRAGEYTFYMYLDESSQLPTLMVRDKSGIARALIDTDEKSSKSGEHTAIDNYTPSPDGKYVAYNLSSGGGELTDIHFIETATGRKLPDVLTWIWGEFGANWLADNSAVMYTRMTRASKTDETINKLHNMNVYLHKLGTPMSEDMPLLGTDFEGEITFSPEEFTAAVVPRKSDWAIGYGLGARNEARVFVAPASTIAKAKPEWKVVADYSDQVSGGLVVSGDSLYYRSTKGAPNSQILKLSLRQPDLATSEVIVPEQQGLISGFTVHNNWLYYSVDVDGNSRLFKKSLTLGQTTEIALPFVGTLYINDYPLGESPFAFALQGWTQPREYFEYLPASDTVRSTGLKTNSNADFSNIVIDRVEATSHDGVKVPLTIIYHKNLKRGGNNPTIMNGYGGYGFSRNPSFNANRLAWFEQGGIYAYAHIRGGGEKGKQWHRGGQGANKKNGVRDFIACAEYLISQGYTSKAHLAVEGGSMGGILLGRAVTEEPELFAASAIYVGMLNPLRYLESQNGANQTAELTAKPDTKEGFEILYNMDAYHNIKPGVKYPSLMIVVGLNDQRVEPWESAKFVAKAQAIAAPENKILLRATEGAGHGIGSSQNQRLLEEADVWSFYLEEFGVD